MCAFEIFFFRSKGELSLAGFVRRVINFLWSKQLNKHNIFEKIMVPLHGKKHKSRGFFGTNLDKKWKISGK